MERRKAAASRKAVHSKNVEADGALKLEEEGIVRLDKVFANVDLLTASFVCKITPAQSSCAVPQSPRSPAQDASCSSNLGEACKHCPSLSRVS